MEKTAEIPMTVQMAKQIQESGAESGVIRMAQTQNPVFQKILDPSPEDVLFGSEVPVERGTTHHGSFTQFLNGQCLQRFRFQQLLQCLAVCQGPGTAEGPGDE